MMVISRHIMESNAVYLLKDYASRQLAHPTIPPHSRARFAPVHAYLTSVVNPNVRISMIKLLLQQHKLASARLRDVNNPPLCRICQLHLEEEVHALCQCTGNDDILQARRDFSLAVHQLCPDLPAFPAHQPFLPCDEGKELLNTWISVQKRDYQFVYLFAGLVNRIFTIYASMPAP